MATTLDELRRRCEALDGLDPSALLQLVADVVEMAAELEALRLRVIAAADARHAYRCEGARDMASWLAWRAGERRGAARRDVELAAAVATRPALSGRLADGSLSKAKAAELARVASASADELAVLVTEAERLTPEQVARRVDRWQAEHAPVEVHESVRITPVAGGGRFEATLDSEGLEWVRLAVDAAAGQLGGDDAPWSERQARGLVGVCRSFVENGPLPMSRLGRPTIVVTVDVATLTAEGGGSAMLDSGAYVTGDVARRLACDADIVRVVTDPASQPLDVGRRRRLPTPAQARAVIHRDRHCRLVGCSAPPWACEIHHLRPWAAGGRTDVANLALLCWHHHSLTHRHDATHHLVEDGDGRLQWKRRRTDQADAA